MDDKLITARRYASTAYIKSVKKRVDRTEFWFEGQRRTWLLMTVVDDAVGSIFYMLVFVFFSSSFAEISDLIVFIFPETNSASCRISRYMLSSCLPVTLSCYCFETTRRIELVLIWELRLTYPKLWCKEIRVSPKIMALLAGTLSPNCGLFRHGKSMMWSTKLVDGRACGLHLRESSAWWLDVESLLHVSSRDELGISPHRRIGVQDFLIDSP